MVVYGQLIQFSIWVVCVTLLYIPQAFSQNLGPDEWFLQIVVSSNEQGGLEDDNNFIGWFVDSSDGKDRRDLIEIPPFSPPFLTIVFPHPDWGADSGDYGTDFRRSKLIPFGEPDRWMFEVRSDQPGRALTLSWDSGSGLGENNERLGDMHLIDVENNVVTPALDGNSVGRYTFTSVNTAHRFFWVFIHNNKHCECGA